MTKRILVAAAVIVVLPVAIWSVKRHLDLRAEGAAFRRQHAELLDLLRAHRRQREAGKVLAHLCAEGRVRVPVDGLAHDEFLLGECAGVLSVDDPEVPYLGRRCTGVYFRARPVAAPGEDYLVLAFKTAGGGYLFNAHPESVGDEATSALRKASSRLAPP